MGNEEYTIDENGNKRYLYEGEVDNQFPEQNKGDLLKSVNKYRAKPSEFAKDGYIGPLDSKKPQPEDKLQLPLKPEPEIYDEEGPRDSIPKTLLRSKIIPKGDGIEYEPSDDYPLYLEPKKKKFLYPRDSERMAEGEVKKNIPKKKPEDNLEKKIFEEKEPQLVDYKQGKSQFRQVIQVPMLRTQKKIKDMDDNEKKLRTPKDTDEDEYRIAGQPDNINSIKQGKYLFPGNEEVIQKNVGFIPKNDNLKYEKVEEYCGYNERKKINKLKEEGNNFGYEEDIPAPSDSFSQEIFREINNMRENPRDYIKVLKKAKQKKIGKNRDGSQTIYRGKNGAIKVALNKGEKAFDEAIKDLENTKPMEPLEFRDALTIPQPDNEIDRKDPLYLKKKVDELKRNDIPIKAYWKDIISDFETCAILLLVDDNAEQKTGRRRKIILNPDIKYMGISSNYVEESKSNDENEKKIPFSTYMTFAKDIDDEASVQVNVQ